MTTTPAAWIPEYTSHVNITDLHSRRLRFRAKTNEDAIRLAKTMSITPNEAIRWAAEVGMAALYRAGILPSLEHTGPTLTDLTISVIPTHTVDQDMRKQLREAAWLLDKVRAQRDEYWTELRNVLDRADWSALGLYYHPDHKDA